MPWTTWSSCWLIFFVDSYFSLITTKVQRWQTSPLQASVILHLSLLISFWPFFILAGPKIIVDIAQHAQECVLGVVRIPVDHLFHAAIAETRELYRSGLIWICNWTLSSAVVSCNVSEPDVNWLLDSMYNRLYRDFDGDVDTYIHVSSWWLTPVSIACLPLAVRKSVVGGDTDKLPKDLTDATFSNTPTLHFIPAQGAGSILLLGGQVCPSYFEGDQS